MWIIKDVEGWKPLPQDDDYFHWFFTTVDSIASEIFCTGSRYITDAELIGVVWHYKHFKKKTSCVLGDDCIDLESIFDFSMMKALGGDEIVRSMFEPDGPADVLPFCHIYHFSESFTNEELL